MKQPHWIIIHFGDAGQKICGLHSPLFMHLPSNCGTRSQIPALPNTRSRLLQSMRSENHIQYIQWSNLFMRHNYGVPLLYVQNVLAHFIYVTYYVYKMGQDFLDIQYHRICGPSSYPLFYAQIQMTSNELHFPNPRRIKLTGLKKLFFFVIVTSRFYMYQMMLAQKGYLDPFYIARLLGRTAYNHLWT